MRRDGAGGSRGSLLWPSIGREDLAVLVTVALVGALVAGGFGIVHDQITYSISPEYFERAKYPQFPYTEIGQSARVRVALIGFLGTWWVGLIAAWLLGRRLLPGRPRAEAYRRIARGALIVLVGGIAGFLGAVAMNALRGPDADYSAWQWAIERFAVEDPWPFIQVAYIHRASYLGAAAGLVLALFRTRESARGRVGCAP